MTVHLMIMMGLVFDRTGQYCYYC